MGLFPQDKQPPTQSPGGIGKAQPVDLSCKIKVSPPATDSLGRVDARVGDVEAIGMVGNVSRLAPEMTAVAQTAQMKGGAVMVVGIHPRGRVWLHSIRGVHEIETVGWSRSLARSTAVRVNVSIMI